MSVRKIVYLFVFFISLFVFSMDYNEQSELEFTKLNNLSTMIMENEDSTILQVELDRTKKGCYEELLRYVQAQDTTALVSRETQNEDLSNNDIYYLYTKDSTKTLSGLFLQHDQLLDFSHATTEYYSSNLDESCIDHIDYLNRKYHKRYHNTIQIYQFDQIVEDKDENQLVFLYLYPKDRGKTIEDLKNSKLADYLVDGWEENDYEPIEFDSYDLELPLKLLSISAITVFVLTICELLHRKKEIMIRKMVGMNNFTILRRMFVPQCMSSIAVYLMGSVLCYCMKIGHIREVTYAFLKSQGSCFLLFVLLQLLLYMVIYFIITRLQEVSETKKTNRLTRIANLNMVLKLVVILLLMQPLIRFVGLGVNEVKSAIFLIENKEALRNQVYISGVGETKEKDFSTIIEELKQYFHEKGGIYQDFFQNKQYEDREDGQEKGLKPYLIVDKNFLANYEIKDQNQQLLMIENLKENTLLIPERYKNEKVTEYCEGDCSVIFIENGMTYYNRDPLTALDQLYSKKDAIVLVKNTIDSSCNWSYPYMLLKVDPQDIAIVRAELANKGLLNVVELRNTNNSYERVLEEIKDNCLYLISLLVVYLVVIFTFLYQTIFLYFMSNREEFALRYLYGNSFFERHGKMIIHNLVIYFIPFLYGWLFIDMNLSELFLFLLMAVVFEMLSSLFLIRKFEKNKLISILKKA